MGNHESAWRVVLPKGQCDEFGRNTITRYWGNSRTEHNAIALCNNWIAHVKHVQEEPMAINKAADMSHECMCLPHQSPIRDETRAASQVHKLPEGCHRTEQDAIARCSQWLAHVKRIKVKEQLQKIASEGNTSEPTTIGKAKQSGKEPTTFEPAHTHNMMEHVKKEGETKIDRPAAIDTKCTTSTEMSQNRMDAKKPSMQMEQRLKFEPKEDSEMENTKRKLETETAGYDELKRSKLVDNMNTKRPKTSIACKLSTGHALLRPVKKIGNIESAWRVVLPKGQCDEFGRNSNTRYWGKSRTRHWQPSRAASEMYKLPEGCGMCRVQKNGRNTSGPAWKAYLPVGQCDEFGRRTLSRNFGKRRTEQDAIAQCKMWLTHACKSFVPKGRCDEFGRQTLSRSFSKKRTEQDAIVQCKVRLARVKNTKGDSAALEMETEPTEKNEPGGAYCANHPKKLHVEPTQKIEPGGDYLPQQKFRAETMAKPSRAASEKYKLPEGCRLQRLQHNGRPSTGPAGRAILPKEQRDKFGRRTLVRAFGKRRTEQNAIAQCKVWLAHAKKIQEESAEIVNTAGMNTRCTTSTGMSQNQLEHSKKEEGQGKSSKFGRPESTTNWQGTNTCKQTRRPRHNCGMQKKASCRSVRFAR